MGERQAEHDEGTGAAHLGRRHPAGVEAAQDDADHRQDAPGLAERTDLLAKGDGRHRRGELGVELAPHDDDQRIVDRRDGAGNEARQQERADRLLDDDAVDHQDGAGRDQRGERAARRHGGRRQPLVVAVAQHLRDRDAGEHRSRGGAGARHRAEARRGEDRRHRKPARQAAEPAARRVEGALGQAGMERQVADQDEHRQDRQRVVRRFLVGEQPGETGARAPAAHGDQAEHAGEAGGKGDAHAEQGEDDDAAAGDETGCQGFHGSGLSGRGRNGDRSRRPSCPSPRGSGPARHPRHA